MGRCIALLLFGLAVFIVSIQCADPPKLNLYLAVTNFQYSGGKNSDGTDVLLDYSDTILMVGVDKLGKIVGSASSFCRHINPPNEQIVLFQATPKYFMSNGSKVVIEEGQSCAPPSYGCITGVNNYCSVKPKAGFLISDNKGAILSATYKPAVGTLLTAVWFNKDVPVFKQVQVKDFAECKKIFDPNNSYLVNEKEQLCTDQVNPEIGSDSIDLAAALLFDNSGELPKLVGIETKADADAGVSLSSWPGYQCNEFEKGNCDP